MGMPQVKAIGTFTDGASNSVTVPWPTHVAGDLALLVVSGQRNSGLTAISGWTLCGSGRSFSGTGSSDNAITVFYRIAESSSEASPVWTHASGGLSGQIITFSDYNPADPITTFAVQNGSSPQFTKNISGNTTAADNALFVLAFVDGNATADNVTSINNDFSIIAEGHNSNTNGFSQYVATKEMPTAGATGTTSLAFNASSNAGVQSISINGSPVSAISGDSSSTLSTNATLVGIGSMAATDASTIVGSGTLTGVGGLAGDAPATVTTSAVLGGTGELIGSTTMTLEVSGTGVGLTDSLLAANVGLTLEAQGTLLATGTMSGTAGASLTSAATLEAIGALSGSSTSTSSASGSISAIVGISGSADMVLTVEPATLDSSFSLGGNAFGVMTPIATLSGVGRLVGSSSSSSFATATATVKGQLQGHSSSTLSTLATLRSLTSPAAANNFRNKWLAVYNARQALMNKITGVTKVTLDSQSTAITDLNNQITHPTTGLTAISGAMTLLSSRVTATEEMNTAQGISITGLTASIAGKADVAVTNTLTARVDTIDSPYNYNLLLNPSMLTGLRNWGTVFWNESGDTGWIVERNLETLGAGYAVPGYYNFGFRHPGAPVTAKNFVAGGDYVEAVAGYEYILSGSIAAANVAIGELRLYFYDETFDLLDEVAAAPNAAGKTGGTNEANWALSYVKRTAPANTKWMRLGLRAYTNAGMAPRVQVQRAMIERARPGQTTPSTWNLGRVAAWAAWDLSFDVNGYISGVRMSNDGTTSDFTINADTFRVLKPAGTAGLTWTNGRLWNRGSDFSVMIGQDMTPDQDVIMWIGPNPASPEAALKEDAAMYIMEDGSAVFRGTINQSLLTGSAMELGSTRIHTGGGRLAPFTLREFGYKGQPTGGSNFSATVTLDGFQSPDVGTGYHHKRFSRKKADVVLECTLHGDGGGGENVYIEVQYDGGTWTTILSKTGINVDYRGGFTFLVRYTTAETWDTMAFRARSTNANTICLAFSATVDNTFESGNTAGSNSGMDATAGGGGSAPPPPGEGGGGGGGGGFCLVADQTFLPDGGMLQDARLGTQILCWDGQLEEPGLELHALRKKPFGYEASFLVTTANGAVVAQSKSTPTPVRDGRMLRAEELLNQEVLTNLAGTLAWSEVVSVEPMGVRRVVKPDVGDRILFAGNSPLATIATHNLRDKDLEP